MKSLRIALLAVVTASLVALVGCEAVNEAVATETEKEPAAIGTLAYAPTQPLQASYIASTSGGPTWHRLDEYGYPGYYGTDVPYHVQPFEVGGAGSYQIYSMQDYDGYLLLYGGDFDPTVPSTGFIAGDDDYVEVGDSLVIADLVADTTYYLVTSGYYNDSDGPFMNAIYGPYAVTGPGSVDHVDYAASTAGAPTWLRCDDDGSLSDIGTEVPYHVQAFEVGGAGNYFVQSVQDYDGYLLLYGGSFDPTAPSTGFIAGDDDFGDVGDSRVIADLVADTTYYLVTSGYDNHSYGSFTNSIDGPYAVTLFGDEDPFEATHSLIDDVEQLADEGVLKAGQANGLIRPLENALRSLEKDNTLDACNQLGDFIMEVEAKVPPLTEAQASELVARAVAIREALGCG